MLAANGPRTLNEDMMPSALQRPHVLIVTDDLGLADFLGEGLVYAGFWTSTIASAMQTLEVFRLRTFDVILLDATLGGIGAAELVRRLCGRSDRSGTLVRTDIPILVIAASRREVPADLAESDDVAAVLFAPIDITDLAEVLWREIRAWRTAHPDRPWADEIAQAPPK
jgi:CheY-like chemotaxis protein